MLVPRKFSQLVLRICLSILMAGFWFSGTHSFAAEPQIARFSLTHPDGHINPAVPRGEAGSIHSGIPACDDDGLCDNGVSIQGAFDMPCPGSETDGWVSLAFPVQTNGAFIRSVEIYHLLNIAGGHLYLLGDCSANPDISDRIYEGCDAIVAGELGLISYSIDPPVATGSTVWVVTVFSETNAFDVGLNQSVTGTGLAYGNLSSDGSCGNWLDMSNFELGYCYCVSVSTVDAPECCTGDGLPQCDGDSNGDGIVDPLDAGYVLARFGQGVKLPNNCQADVNCDGVIDPLDAGYVLARFGTCSPVSGCAVGGGDCRGAL